MFVDFSVIFFAKTFIIFCGNKNDQQKPFPYFAEIVAPRPLLLGGGGGTIFSTTSKGGGTIVENTVTLNTKGLFGRPKTFHLLP